MLAGCALAGAALADQHRLQRDFTFRRVTVPKSPQPGSRIDVQIAPQGEGGSPATTRGGGSSGRLPQIDPDAGRDAGADTGPAAAPASVAPRSDLAWFWDRISPELTASGPGRLQLAMSEIGKAPAGANVPEPSLATLAAIAEAHGIEILASTVGTRVSPALVLAVIAVESGGRADAESGAGAQGLMQLMPATAERFGVADSLDAGQNIKGGVAYLDWLMGEFGEDPILFLAAYNAGEGAVRSNGGGPPYAETRDYVPKVIAAWTRARALCLTPPDLMTDGCVFQRGG